jgi:anti-anti-sigma regulatory factor
MRLAEPRAAAILRLPPVLDSGGAEGLRRGLQESLARSGGVAVQGGDVERVSTACLQVLVAAARTARSRGQTFRLEAASSCLHTALEELGLSAVIAGGDTT